ncbi:Sds3-like-domain-containing protein [Lasiosphaeris hirsuta]|uniref:Sds3-like-domain-containing protein n=1 Tax=Lasiosphaeris hirsuta TaxID=260670 RepID=A0AA40BBM9_9PEZI|nr:Sds3-like-domain-containing protein [Lasiosphaeris hirsuta]
MATGDTAPPLALSSSPPPLLDNSPSNLSSPLSDVEDKDPGHEGMDIDTHENSPAHPGTPKRNGRRGGEDSDADEESDDDSKLSEMDVNDSEAETERLYDTPPKNGVSRDMLNILSEVGNRQFVDRRARAFERSPSKLQQQLQAELAAANPPSDNDSLSDADDGEDDDASLASSEPEPDSAKDQRLRSPTQTKKPQETIATTESAATQLARQDSQESRKRKRPSLAEQSEAEQPLRKRTGSIAALEADFSANDAAVADDESLSTNPQSVTHTGEEDNNDEADVASKKEAPVESVESVEEDKIETTRSKKAKRNATKKRKSKSPDESTGQVTEEAHDDPPDDADGDHATGDHTHQVEDEHTGDADEEAEVAHKNEEELERKKAAWEELTAIEKQFSNFRERLYQERLEQLNREEALLTCENPTHPEYVAMLQCIEERRNERIRVSTLELQLNLQVLNNRAVAERAQMMTQFYQGVREARERVLEELGQEWYEIQQERRRYANTIPDYGIRFPATKTQTIKQAVAYNKEVSILSGFAKHVGFPAAPPIHGATDDQLESDLEAIVRAREPVSRPVANHQQAFPPEFAGGLPFGRILGPAGEQFIEQTPWANPNHPSHQIQRQHSQHSPQETGALPGTSTGPRRRSHQPGAVPSSSNMTIPNGDSLVQVQKANSSGGHESTTKGSKMGAEASVKRESIAQAS